MPRTALFYHILWELSIGFLNFFHFSFLFLQTVKAFGSLSTIVVENFGGILGNLLPLRTSAQLLEKHGTLGTVCHTLAHFFMLQYWHTETNDGPRALTHETRRPQNQN